MKDSKKFEIKYWLFKDTKSLLKVFHPQHIYFWARDNKLPGTNCNIAVYYGLLSTSVTPSIFEKYRKFSVHAYQNPEIVEPRPQPGIKMNKTSL